MADEIMIAQDKDESAASVQVASAWSTIKAETVQDKLTIASMLTAAESLNGHEGEVFTLTQVFFKPGIRKGRDGMPDQECSDTYLLTADGIVYFSKSSGINRSVRNILMCLPDLNAPEGVKVKVDKIELGGGRTYKQLVPVL